VSPKRSKVFDETCRQYLQEIRSLDFLAKAAVLGLQIDDGKLVIPLYNKIYRLGVDGIFGDDGKEINPAVQVMICKYVLTCPLSPPEKSDKLITYREFKDAGPLVSYFTNNTKKTLETAFSGNIAGLRKRGQEIGGRIIASESYDLSLEFHAFPRIPVRLNFNDQDDLFSAGCSILYRSCAAYFLDMECLAMTGTLLTGKLIATVGSA
jgi:hypothetical protein